MERMVFMPVAFEHIGDVQALLDRLESKGGTEGEVAAPDRSEILRRIFDDCAEGTRRILLELARHPGDWIKGIDLAKVANPGSERRNTSPYMKSLGVAQNRHLPAGEEPTIQARRGGDRLWLFMMTPADAAIVQGFAS